MNLDGYLTKIFVFVLPHNINYKIEIYGQLKYSALKNTSETFIESSNLNKFTVDEPISKIFRFDIWAGFWEKSFWCIWRDLKRFSSRGVLEYFNISSPNKCQETFVLNFIKRSLTNYPKKQYFLKSSPQKLPTAISVI